MAVNVQVLDEKGLPVRCTVAAVRSSDQTILNLYDTDPTTGVATINEAGTWYPRPMVDPVYKARLRMVILNSQGLMNADYVVDSSGGGTHAALHGASGALAAAVATGADKTIWVCTSHRETVNSEQSLGAMTAGVKITIASNGAIITVGVGNGAAVFNTPGMSNPPTFHFQGIRYDNAAGTASNFFRPSSATTSGAVLILENCHFTNTGSVWGYIYVGHTLEGNASVLGGLKISGGRYNITAFWTTDNSSNSATIYPAGQGSELVSKFICQNADIVAADFNVSFGAASADGFSRVIITGNRGKITSNALNVGSDYGGLNGMLHFTGNDFDHTANGDFISIKNNCQNIVVTGNSYRASGAAGASTCFFHNNASTPLNVIVASNELFGPGSGTAISIQGTTPTNAVFEPNTYRGWTTNLAGTGATTKFVGDVRMSSFGIDSTISTDIGMNYYRSGVLKAYQGIWRIDTPQSPFGPNDFHLGTYDGSFHDTLGFANNGTQVKVPTNELVTGYLYIGAASGTGATWTAPAAGSAGDVTGKRFFVNNDLNYTAQFNGTFPQFRFDAGDYLEYNRTNNRLAAIIGSAAQVYVDSVNGFRVVSPVVESTLGETGVRFGVNTNTPRVILECSGTSVMEMDNNAGVLRFYKPGIVLSQMDSSGNWGMLGYLGLGAIGTPANIAAGDFSAFRVNLGSPWFDVGANNIDVLGMQYVDTATAVGARFMQQALFYTNAGANSSAELRSLSFELRPQSSFNYTSADGQKGIYVLYRRVAGTGTDTRFDAFRVPAPILGSGVLTEFNAFAISDSAKPANLTTYRSYYSPHADPAFFHGGKFELGSSANIGFFGTAATTKQTVSGSRGGNAALASLLSALAAHGLLTDSSTA